MTPYFIIRSVTANGSVWYRAHVDHAIIWSSLMDNAELFTEPPPRGPNAPPWDMVELVTTE